MCRLLAVTNFDIKTHKELLRNFLALAQFGKVLPGDLPGHLDGWGIGWYEGGEARTEKSGNSAIAETSRINELLERIGNSKLLIAHLRKSAWENTSVERHAHPFEFQNTIFAHNGTVRDFQKNLALLKPEFAPAPDSKDTEVFFRYILQNSKGQEFKTGLENSIDYVKTNNTYTSLNLLMTDGKSLLALREYADKPGFADYYTLFKSPEGIISSEPVSKAINWAPMKNGEFIEIKLA